MLNTISIDKPVVDKRKENPVSITIKNVRKPNDKFNPTHLSLMNNEGSEIDLGMPKF